MMDPAKPTPKRRASTFTRERLADIKPVAGRCLIKPFLPNKGTAILAGPSETLKTAFALEMSLRLSRGEPFCGHKVRQAGVVYVSAEDPNGVRNRVTAWCVENGRHGAFQLIPQPPDLRDGERRADLMLAIREAAEEFDAEGTPLGLIVFDTVSKSAPGADQNSSADMGLIMSTLDKIGAETDATVLVIAHTPKDEARGIAGWYGQYAGADTVIMATRDPDDPDLRTATLAKVKNGPGGQKFAFRLRVIGIGQDEDGITSFVLAFEDVCAQRTAKPAKVVKLGAPETVALRAITYAMDTGATEPAPAEQGVKHGTRAVQLSAVRARAFATGFADETTARNTRNVRWSRSIEKLVSAQRIRLAGELVWPV